VFEHFFVENNVEQIPNNFFFKPVVNRTGFRKETLILYVFIDIILFKPTTYIIKMIEKQTSLNEYFNLLPNILHSWC